MSSPLINGAVRIPYGPTVTNIADDPDSTSLWVRTPGRYTDCTDFGIHPDHVSECVSEPDWDYEVIGIKLKYIQLYHEELISLFDQLDEEEKKQNDGRGVECVRHIIKRFREGRHREAATTRTNEGDKTRSYPKIEGLLWKIFGCRTHLKYNCENDLCKSLKPSE